MLQLQIGCKFDRYKHGLHAEDFAEVGWDFEKSVNSCKYARQCRSVFNSDFDFDG
jgi:hypothetical protein